MKIPPILVLDDDQSLLEMLKAIARQELALARYAGAEAERISLLVRRLEDFGREGVPPEELAALGRRTAAAARAAETCQASVQSQLEAVLDHLDAEPLFRLTAPAEAYCRVRAGGRGTVTMASDPFHRGVASLETADVAAAAGRVTGLVRYRVEKGTVSHRLESVEDALTLELVVPPSAGSAVPAPRIALISGYGVLSQAAGTVTERHLARFALTVWGRGGPGGSRFRMMHVAPHCKDLSHDSGIVSS